MFNGPGGGDPHRDGRPPTDRGQKDLLSLGPLPGFTPSSTRHKKKKKKKKKNNNNNKSVSPSHARAIVLSCESYLSRNVFLSLSLSLCTGSDVSGARVRARVCLRRAFLPGPEGFPKKKLGSSLVLASINTDVHNWAFFEGRSLFLSLGPRVVCELSSMSTGSASQIFYVPWKTRFVAELHSKYGSCHVDPRNFIGSQLSTRLKVSMSMCPQDTSDVLQAHLDRLLRVAHQSL